MFAQSACVCGCIVTLIAFVWFFSIVCFQMCFQILCLGGNKVTMFAFKQFFTTMDFPITSQISCLGGCKVALIAFVWLCVFVSILYARIFKSWIHNVNLVALWLVAALHWGKIHILRLLDKEDTNWKWKWQQNSHQCIVLEFKNQEQRETFIKACLSSDMHDLKAKWSIQYLV